jgi:hypothetical protein
MKVYFVTGDVNFFKDVTKFDRDQNYGTPNPWQSLSGLPDGKVVMLDVHCHPANTIQVLIDLLDCVEKQNSNLVLVSFDLLLFDALRVLVNRGKVSKDNVFIYERVGNQWNQMFINPDGRVAEDFPKVFNIYEDMLMEILKIKGE